MYVLEKHSDTFIQEEGVVQGGVLSVPLFAIAINDIVESVPDHMGCSLFVDDLAIWWQSSSFAAAERELQLTIRQLESWATTNLKNGSCAFLSPTLVH